MSRVALSALSSGRRPPQPAAARVHRSSDRRADPDGEGRPAQRTDSGNRLARTALRHRKRNGGCRRLRFADQRRYLRLSLLFRILYYDFFKSSTLFVLVETVINKRN